MTRIKRIGLLLAGTALLASTSAQADANDDELIVVGIKDPTSSILTYPGSVAVVDEAELEQRQFEDLSTLSYAAPNISLDPIGTFKGVANFSIRGLGINSSIPSIDPAVGLFVDGVYMGINAGTVFDTLDVERVELLRGPQGVAFGRNTTGGAVLVKTGDPDFDQWSGHARLGVEGPVDGGRGGPMVTGRAVLSGPISDTLAIRLGALHSKDDGYFRNSFNGKDFGEAKTTVLRGALAWKAAERLKITIKLEYTDSDGDGAATHNNGQNARDSFNLAVDQEGFYHSKNKFVMARGDYDLGKGSLTNIFGWRKYDLRTRNDIDSSPVKIFESDTGTAQEQWSNELYYAADYGALALTLGGYVFHQDIGYDETRDLAGFGLPIFYGGGRQDHDVYGIYGQFDYDLTSALILTAGLRWSREEKDAAITYVRIREACSAIAGTCPVTGENIPGENNGFTNSRSWDNFSPRLAISFRPSDDAALYASWTRGYRSGGYNLRITQPADFEIVAERLGSPGFDDERVDSFELGAKWRSGDGRVSLNSALFWTEVDNLQRELNLPSVGTGIAQSVYNTADARIRGGELEAVFTPFPALSFTANFGYTDADYRRIFFDLNSDRVIDGADYALELPRAPKWTWGGSATYEAQLGGKATLTANAFFQHRSRYAYTDNNWGFNSASDRLDASIALNLGDPDITFTLYGKNLLDEVQFGGDTQLPFAGGPFSDGNNRPFDPSPAFGTFSPVFKGRVLGIEVGMNF